MKIEIFMNGVYILRTYNGVYMPPLTLTFHMNMKDNKYVFSSSITQLNKNYDFQSTKRLNSVKHNMCIVVRYVYSIVVN